MDKNRVMKPHAIVIAIPYQGHLNPLVHLAIKLASNGFAVTFVHFEHAHHLISKSHHITNFSNNNNDNEVDIFSEARSSGLDIRYTTISDGFPVEFDRNQNVEEYWESLLNDFPSRVDEFIWNIIESTSDDPSLFHCLVSDTLWSWSGMIAGKYNIVNVSFWTEPAMVFAICYYLDLLRENGHFPLTENHDYTIDYIPGVESFSTKDLMSYFREADPTKIIHKITFKAFEEVKKADFILHNKVQGLESHTLSTLHEKHPRYAIGPVNFSTDHITNISKSMLCETDCTKWLDSKSPGSVLYVSFGSMVQTDSQVIEEIARGLLSSEVNFIWAMRHSQVENSINSTRALPIGFLDDVKDRGLVVPWCNQTAVLSNPAVGGFLTHCGWNSILESMWCCVPMICYPVCYDQPTNRKLVVDDWKIGINLCDGVSINGDEVASKIKMLMSGKFSDGIRNEMKKIMSIMHNASADDGSSERNFDKFVKDFKDKMNA
ncbi:hypothetical protein OROGR_006289 [Orobanche gracilis]